MPQHHVESGECVHSLAAERGLTIKSIWLHSQNSELRQKRKSPHLLCAGDVLFIPDADPRQEAGSTAKKHQFKRKGVRAKLQLILKRNGEAVADKPFRLDLSGQGLEGTTDAKGLISLVIPSTAKQATLHIQDWNEALPLNLGGLDPIDEISGIQARLKNLGLTPGPIDGIDGPKTQAAVRNFQAEVDAKVDGIVGPETKGLLEKKYGC